MGKRTRTALLVVLALVSTGCWMQPGGSPGRARYAVWEQTFTPDTVGSMVEIWRTPMPPTSRGTGPVVDPVTADGVVYAANQAIGLAAIDLKTGTLRWGVEQYFYEWYEDPVAVDIMAVDDDWGLWTSLRFADNRFDVSYYNKSAGAHLAVYGNAGPLGLTAEEGVAMVQVRGDGVGPWSAGLQYTGDRTKPWVQLGPDVAIPGYAFAGDVALWSEGGDALAFTDCPFAGQADACPPAWRTPLGDRPVGPAVVGTDAVVYPDVGGTVHMLDRDTGAVLYRAELGAAISVPPAVAGDVVLVATDDGRLVALPADGCGHPVCTPLWEGAIGDDPATGPVAGTQLAYVAQAGGGIAAFELPGCGEDLCEPVRVVPTAAPVTGGPILEAGRLVVGLADGSVAAYGLVRE